jgi:hypothetical protein
MPCGMAAPVCMCSYHSCTDSHVFPYLHCVHRVEGRHSNAAYNRHLANSKPRAAPASAALPANAHHTGSSSSSRTSSSALSLSPERVIAAAQAGLAQAAALADRVTLKSGTWDHVLIVSGSSYPAPPPATAAVHTAAACGASHRATGSCASEEGSVSSMPTTYCRSQVLQHSLWLHDGTDFTSGRVQQVSSGFRTVTASSNSCVCSHNRLYVCALLTAASAAAAM